MASWTCGAVDHLARLQLMASKILERTRLYAETKAGYAFTFIFATPEVVAPWPKIKVPDSQDFRQKATDMESPTIGVNFSFSGLPRSSE